MAEKVEAIQGLKSQDRSIADEVQQAVREKKPLTIRRIITNEYFLNIVSMIAFLLVWHYAAASGAFSGALCTPWQVVEQFRNLMTDTLAGLTIWGHIWASTQRIFIGFVLASLVAIPLGLFMALNPYVDAIVKPVFDIFKPMPPIAWISIAILWFGIGEPSKIFIIVIGTFVPCLLNAYNGIRLIDPEMYDVIKVLGGRRRNEIIQVSFPASFPAIFAGLQISLSSAWTCVLAAELVASRSGLGFIIVQGMKISDTSMVIGGMIIIAIVAWLTSLLVMGLEKLLCPWKRGIGDL
ncbi:MAG: ABC transporter permease [Deltaproteobacteria bacterium]|nr:ABC transporter permease [Deltaproteobacteria bacterium]